MLPGGWFVAPYAVAPDGSFWAGWPRRSQEDWGQGVSRFDGQTWVRYLPGMYVHWFGGMDIAPDGSVWVLASEGAGVDPQRLYVITPEAVETSE